MASVNAVGITLMTRLLYPPAGISGINGPMSSYMRICICMSEGYVIYMLASAFVQRLHARMWVMLGYVGQVMLRECDGPTAAIFGPMTSWRLAQWRRHAVTAGTNACPPPQYTL